MIKLFYLINSVFLENLFEIYNELYACFIEWLEEFETDNIDIGSSFLGFIFSLFKGKSLQPLSSNNFTQNVDREIILPYTVEDLQAIYLPIDFINNLFFYDDSFNQK
jgi:hypothetical protein